MARLIRALRNRARSHGRHATAASHPTGLSGGGRDRGAALVTVLLFVVLVLILITTMLSVTGNEVVIAGAQRDGVRALDLAQATLQEAIVRLQNGRPYVGGFQSSLVSAGTVPGATVNVSVNTQFVGTNSAYLELRVDATVGRATRRLSQLVLQRMVMFPPNVMFGQSLAPEGQNVKSGDVYAAYGIFYESSLFAPSSTFTYAGWRIYRNLSPDPPGPCYYRGQVGTCGNDTSPNTVNWFPATRLTVSASSPDGLDLLAQTNKCPAGGGGSLPPTTIGSMWGTSLVPASAPDGTAGAGNTATYNLPSFTPVYGFDTDDPTGTNPQAVTSALPCGLPYKYVQRTFNGEVDSAAAGTIFTRLFKVVVFEQWFNNYWHFDPVQMSYVKNSGGTTGNLTTYPQYGAIPPSTTPASLTASTNYNSVLSGGGTVIQSSTDWGCKLPEESPCSPDHATAVLLDGTPNVTNWTISGVVWGHGTLVVNGNLTWAAAGQFLYYGTVIVNGTVKNSLCACSPAPNQIYGGLVSTQPYVLHDATAIYGGTTATSVPVGTSVVDGKAWWER